MVGLIFLAVPALVSAQSLPTLRILVTNNYDELSSRMLGDAKSDVAAIYRDAGFQIEWVDRMETDLPLVVAFPPAGGAERLDLGPYVLGNTFRSIGAASGGRALIFVDRVERRSLAAHINVTRLLAAVIAHEIGHMLLSDAHSQTGLMRANWGDHDLRLIDMGGLRFSAGEPDRFRRQLLGLPAMTRFDTCLPIEMCPCSSLKISMMSR